MRCVRQWYVTPAVLRQQTSSRWSDWQQHCTGGHFGPVHLDFLGLGLMLQLVGFHTRAYAHMWAGTCTLSVTMLPQELVSSRRLGPPVADTGRAAVHTRGKAASTVTLTMGTH